MIAVTFIEAFLIVVLAVFAMTQIILPLLAGTKLFPMFSRRAKLKDELIDLREEEEIIELEAKVAARREQLKQKRGM